MQCVCGAVGAAAGWGRPQPQRPHRHVTTNKKEKFLRSSASAYAAINIKNTRCGILRLSRTMLEKRRQNFGAGKILPKGRTKK
jgi:hypothetical protein